jgi:hypothetical protein
MNVGDIHPLESSDDFPIKPQLPEQILLPVGCVRWGEEMGLRMDRFGSTHSTLGLVLHCHCRCLCGLTLGPIFFFLKEEPCREGRAPFL